MALSPKDLEEKERLEADKIEAYLDNVLSKLGGLRSYYIGLDEFMLSDYTQQLIRERYLAAGWGKVVFSSYAGNPNCNPA